jgi:excisionase family DNA binding protein
MAGRIRFGNSRGTALGNAEVGPPRSLKLLSVKDSADYAKVSQQTIRRAIKAGHLKSYRAGRQIRIDESDLVHYLSP